MSWSENTSQIQVGDEVLGNDGGKVGTVAEVQPSYLVIEKGFFFPTDYYIPLNVITHVGAGQVALNVSKDAALHSGWETLPETTTGAILTDVGATAIPATDVVTGTAVDAATWRADTAVGETQMAGYEVTDEDELIIPLREEDLTATVRDVEAGAARIQKRVISEDRVLEVPVIEEHIRVERRVVDRAADAGDADAFEEIVIEVPLTAEQVELRKQTRVAEEVVITREAVQHTEQVHGTVRREEVDVIDETATTGLINAADSRI